MEASDRFEKICQAMADPAFYPHAVSHLERRDTHISAVFLTGGWVYKLKRPVDFGFLDFKELESRRFFCEREMKLNQRLSHGIYAEVIGIAMDHLGRLHMGGAGEIVEYAVKMRQLPEEASLRKLLQLGKAEVMDMERLGRHLADFYERSMRNPEIEHYEHPDVIAFNMEENFYQIEPFVNDLVSLEEWEFIRQVSRTFFLNYGGLFEHRIEAGRIRDGHGDLRCEHIYFFNGIQIIDCIEFNDRFRYGDVISDLAFLHMDMEHWGGSLFTRYLLAAYAERAKDFEIYALLDFYAAYRALVKVKVACLRSTEVNEAKEREELRGEARSYLGQAYRYALQFSRPTIWIFMGLPATGKSSLAEAVSRTLSLPVIQSDLIRRELPGRHPDHAQVVPYNHGIYHSTVRQRVYGKMLSLAQEQLKHGHSVVLDATFSKRRWRDEVRQLALDLDTNLVFVECSCDEAIIRSRLQQREEAPGVSDARLQHLPELMKEYEAPMEIMPEHLLRVHTDRSFLEVLSEVLAAGYTRKCAQVRFLI